MLKDMTIKVTRLEKENQMLREEIKSMFHNFWANLIVMAGNGGGQNINKLEQENRSLKEELRSNCDRVCLRL
jgi:hypothetical protein